MNKRLQYLLLPVFSFVFFSHGIAQTITWNFTAGTAAPSTTAAGVTAAELVQGNNNGTTSFITSVSVSTGYAGASGTNNAGLAARTGVLNTGASGSAYVEFMLTPASGKVVTLTAISFGSRSTSTGPQAYTLRTAADNYTTDKTTGTLLANSAWALQSKTALTVSGTAGTALTFRLYGYNGVGTSSANTANWRLDDINLTLSVGDLSNNAALSNLVLSAGSLTPSFTSGTTSYTTSVANSVSSISVTPTASDAAAGIKVNTVPVGSGTASSPVPLNVGDNTITTTVTAPDGTTTQTYVVTVNRASGGTPALTASSIPSFGNVCINTTVTNSFTLTGSDLDATAITLAAVPGFQYAEVIGGPYANTISFTAGSNFSKVIYVQFTPLAAQSYNGSITINGGGVSDYAAPVSGSGINPPPVVTTGSSSEVSGTTATLSATIASDGCSPVSSYGLEYSTTAGAANGTGTPVSSTNLSNGSFTASLSGLTANTTYYYKAFATNSGGTSYGAQASFKTKAVPVVMATQEDLTYTETFSAVAGWANGFTVGIGANRFSSVAASGTTPIPSPTVITSSTATFVSGSSGGVQKGAESLVLLSTAATDNTTSAAVDFFTDFTGVNAGNLSFDWASVNNGTGDRKGSLRIYASTNGTTFTELTGAGVLNFTNNVPTNGSINVALPATFSNSATASLRFYYHNAAGGTIGSRPKISIDNLSITAISTTPCVIPVAQPTALAFSNITETSVQGSFTPSSPAANKYLVIMSQSSSLTSNPVDGQVYEPGDNVGDGDVISYSAATTFTASGLSGATTYNLFVFAVNSSCAGGPKYLTAAPLSGEVTTVAGLPTCTAPDDQPTALSLSSTTNSVLGSFTGGTASEYLVLRSTEATPTAQPQNGQVYTSGSAIGNAFVVQKGNATAFTNSGLAPDTKYYFFIYSFAAQGCIGGPAYNTVQPLTGFISTQPLSPCSTPLSQPTNLSFSTSNTALSGTFNGSATADNYLVIRSTSNTLTTQPSDNTNYTTGDSYGGGTVVATTSSTSFVNSGLVPGTTYYFFVYAANKTCTGGTKYLSTNPLTGSVTTKATPAYNVYFGNLHSHSDYSDGNKDRPGFTPADDYAYAKTAECMDFLGISEHNHFSSLDNPGTTITNYHKGSIQADNFSAANPGFVALYGMEWGVISGGGHVVVYGDGMDKLFGWESNVGGVSGPNYDVFVPKNDYTGTAGLFKTINDFIANNTFATLAHPNNTDYNNLSNSPYNLVADNAIVGTAVANGPSTSTNTTYSNPGASYSYLWYYQKLLSLGYHLGPNIDHDNHNTTFGKTTRARTAVLAPSLSKAEIVKAMREMRFYSTEDCDTKVDFTINTRVMGSVFSDRNAPSISVRLTDASTPTASAKIRLMFGVPGSKVMAVALDSVIGSSFDYVDNNLAVNTTGYYYTEITNGGAKVVTSPIWYTRTCSFQTDTTATACNSFTWYGTTYTSSVTTSRQFTTAGGCDSTATLHLTINYPTTGDTTAAACESFTWYSTTYTASGDYTHVLKSVGGCDSTLTLHLTINPKPVVSVTASGAQSFCPGGSVVLTTSAAASYKWSTEETTNAITVNKTGSYSVTVTDANGCSATSAPIAITVEDKTPPSVVTQNITVQLNTSGVATITASQVNNGSSDNCAIATDGYALDKTVFDCSNVGANTVTLTVRDASGNSAGATATVTVVDPIAPTFTIPSSQGVTLGSGCSIVVPDLVTGLSGSDNCGNVTFTQLPVAGSSLSSSHSQTHTITITANDGHGNTTSGNVTLTAKDQTFPLLTPPAAVTVNTDNGKCSASAVALGIPSYSDNCPGTTVANDAPATYQKGVTSITWTATDAAGNILTATQTVTVTDNEKPVLTCPTVPVQCYVSSGTYTVPLLTAIDNCSIASITFAITGSTTRNGSGTNAGGSFNEGSSVITWTVVDGSGNSSTCTTTVVINPRLTSLIPDVYAVNPGGSANTLYKGYGPTSLTLNASVSGGTGPYSYKWTVGSSAGQGISTSPSLTESPTATTMYYFNVKDAYGCSAPLMTRTIEVVDVRCGPRLDKVTVCVLQKGVPTTSCVTQNSVQGSLSNGGYLGSCLVSAATTKIRKVEIANELSTPELSISVLPNPSPSSFQLQIRSRNESPVTIRVISGLGVVIETRRGIGSNGTISIGSSYRPGVYYVEAAQDGKRVTQKLIKLSE